MANKIISTLTKSLGAKIVWIGGATAGMTALFSALGFLVLKGHHDLLGISGLVPTEPDAWAIEGAKFVYSTVYLLFAGCLNRVGILALALAIVALLGITSSKAWLEKIRKYTAPRLVRLFLIALTLAMLIGSIAVIIQGQTSSHLLINPSNETFQQEIIPRTTETGLNNLAFRYAAYAMLVAFLSVWLKVLPQFIFSPPAATNGESAAAPEHPVWYNGLWGIFLIHLLLLPILYGQLVKGNEYFKVCLLPAIEENSASTSACAGQQGWLLYKGAEEIALYMASSQTKPVQLFKQKEFKQVQVLAYENVMTAIPSPSSSGTTPSKTRPSSGLSMAEMGQFLRNIPATVAAGIRPMTRLIPAYQRTLVIANAEGQTLNTFSPFQDDQKGYLLSPILLPGNDRILYVEVVDNTPHLKIVAANFDPNTDTYFGTPAVEGWEPQLTPDGQSVIFRQGRTKLFRIDIDGKNPTLLLEDQELGRLLGVFPEADNQSYSFVYSKQQDNKMTYWSASVQGNTVMTSEQPLDDETWRLLGRLSIHNGRILYEQEDSMILVKKDNEWVLADEGVDESDETRTQKFFNIHLSDSIETEGRPITNMYSGTIPSHNRYPTWSPDGSMIVYVSGE